MALKPDEVRARWPELAPLLAVTGPPWLFCQLAHGRFFGTRQRPGCAEVFYIADRDHVSVNRGPVGSWYSSPAPSVDFTGPIADAVAALLAPPTTERSS